jgi:large-conductance mechanosensitive channel
MEEKEEHSQARLILQNFHKKRVLFLETSKCYISTNTLINKISKFLQINFIIIIFISFLNMMKKHMWISIRYNNRHKRS